MFHNNGFVNPLPAAFKILASSTEAGIFGFHPLLGLRFTLRREPKKHASYIFVR